MPRFFVPNVKPADHEKAYVQLAEFAGRPIPSRRVCAVTVVNEGTWEMEVGKPAHMVKTLTGKPASRVDRAMILAIFPGEPTWMVVFDGPSTWSNPAMVKPESVDYFEE